MLFYKLIPLVLQLEYTKDNPSRQVFTPLLVIILNYMCNVAIAMLILRNIQNLIITS